MKERLKIGDWEMRLLIYLFIVIKIKNREGSILSNLEYFKSCVCGIELRQTGITDFFGGRGGDLHDLICFASKNY